MQNRLSFALRVGVGTVIGVVAVIVILKIGDNAVVLPPPSHLYQAQTTAWTLDLPWWGLAGVGIGLVAAAVAFRTKNHPAAISFVTILATIVLSAFILAGLALQQADELTISSLILLGAIDIAFFILPAFIPALFAMLFGNLIGNTVEAMLFSRSTTDIMPEELRQQHEARLRQRRPAH